MEPPGAWHLTDRPADEHGKADPFAAAVRATRMPMIVTDPRQDDNPIVFANDAFLTLTGYAREEIMGINCRFLQGEGTDPDAIRRLRDAIRERRDVTVELENYRKDGTPFRNMLYIGPVFSEAGELQFFFASQFDTTEQAGALEALRQREAELRLILEGASDYAILTADRDHRVTSWSMGAEKAFGWTAEEMIGRPADTIFTPVDRAQGVPDRELGTAEQEGCANDERWHQRKDGSRVFMNGSVRLLPCDSQGRERGFIKVARDETDRRLAEERLLESEERLRLATDAAEIGFWDHDQVNHVLVWTPLVRKMFGVPDDAPVSMRVFRDGIHPEDRDAIMEAFAAAGDPARRSVYDVEYRTVGREDGVVRWVAAQGRALFDENDRCTRILGTARDITRRKRIEERLHDLNDDLEAQVAARTGERNQLWDLSRDIMLRFRRDGRILTANPAWAETLGWGEGELVGSSLFRLIHPDDCDGAKAGFEAARDGGDARVEHRYRHRDGGYHWISWSIRVVGDVVLAIGRDTTDEREAADALAHAEEALRQSQKMEAIGQLTGGVAHDFNNLLTVIRGSVDLLRREGVPAEKRQRYLDAIGDTADRAAKLTGQLLAFARRQTLAPETFEVARRLDAISDMLDSVTGARVRVRIEIDDMECRVRADVSQFETALVNLAVNARDAMDGTGTITVRLHCGARLPPIRGHGGGTGEFVAIAVTDTGTGIAAENLERIFEPFFTTKETGRGTGLGLSQVFGFAKQSGGDVDVESEVGRGSTFTLYLPQAQTAVAEERAASPAPASADGEGRCVLVVEDNVSVGQFATQLLDDLGYRTDWVMSAEEALERLGEDGAGFDVVFSDVVMPGMGGIELAKRLARDLPRLPVVLASGYSHVLAQEGTAGIELLRKPYSANQLSDALHRLSSRGP